GQLARHQGQAGGAAHGVGRPRAVQRDPVGAAEPARVQAEQPVVDAGGEAEAADLLEVHVVLQVEVGGDDRGGPDAQARLQGRQVGGLAVLAEDGRRVVGVVDVGPAGDVDI